MLGFGWGRDWSGFGLSIGLYSGWGRGMGWSIGTRPSIWHEAEYYWKRSSGCSIFLRQAMGFLITNDGQRFCVFSGKKYPRVFSVLASKVGHRMFNWLGALPFICYREPLVGAGQRCLTFANVV